MRIVYGVQSTGRGHLTRFLGLLPLFQRDSHELLVFVTGRWDPPAYFLDALEGVRVRRFPGLSMVPDGTGGVSKRRTVKAFATHLPGLFRSFYKANRWIAAFEPDLIVSDFDPITGSPFVAPSVFKVGIGNCYAPVRFDVEHPTGFRRERFNVRVVNKLGTSGLDVRLTSHFYPLDEECLPPILRPETLCLKPENRGHILAYYAFPGLLPPVLDFAKTHPTTPIILYGQRHRPRGLPDNVHVELDPSRFLGDFADCAAFVGTAGFQSIAEGFFLGKKLVVQPIEGHYEQIWNASELERCGMGRICRGNLERALDQTFDSALHERLVPWYESGAQRHYERILSCVPR